MRTLNIARSPRRGMAFATLILACSSLPLIAAAHTPETATETAPSRAAQQGECTIDLHRVGQMSDVLSNALMHGLNKPEVDVRAFLVATESQHTDGASLLAATADHFKVSEADMNALAERFRHVSCTHKGGGNEGANEEAPADAEGDAEGGVAPFQVSTFASDVTLHVVLHEMGHALVREFDLPILGNEETLADAFATYFLTTHMPDRALAVLSARTRSLMIEADEVPRAEWTVRGEHNSDARRAHQIAALAIAADPGKYRAVALGIGMSEGEMRSASDYGTEIHRSWRRILDPLWMPAGTKSIEARLDVDSESAFGSQIQASGLSAEIENALRRFDWHSQVKVRFEDSEGGAGWNRSRRTITVHSEYVQRFVRQGETATKEFVGTAPK